MVRHVLRIILLSLHAGVIRDVRRYGRATVVAREVDALFRLFHVVQASVPLDVELGSAQANL